MKILVKVNLVEVEVEADSWYWDDRTVRFSKNGCEKCKEENKIVAEYSAYIVESVRYVNVGNN